MHDFHTEILFPYTEAETRAAARRAHVTASFRPVRRPWSERLGSRLVAAGVRLTRIGAALERCPAPPATTPVSPSPTT